MVDKAEDKTAIKLSEIEALLNGVREKQLSIEQWLVIERVLIIYCKLLRILQKKKPLIKQIKLLILGSEVEFSNEEIGDNQSQEQAQKPKEPKVRKKVARHGRHKAEDLTGAKRVECNHQDLHPGSDCPDVLCNGHLQRYKRKAKFTQYEGQPLLGATNYYQENLRCSDCGRTFAAKLPDGVKPEKYRASADAAIVMAKYGQGIPWNRLSDIQARFGIPLSPSVMWARCEAVANILFPIFIQLRLMAALCSVIYYDDTSIKIINCQPSKADIRKGIRTTGMVADLGDKKIALYASGRPHAGDNVNEVLKKRPQGLGQVIRMCDALNLNLADTGDDTISLCLSHGTRKFEELKKSNYQYCKYVLDELKKVFINDEQTKQMSDIDRLIYHKQHSGPIMSKLKEWIEDKFKNKIVEPNGALGAAFNYMLSHWNELTQFLKTAKAPITNNLCERALKLVVLHRKNALYYRSDVGAFVSDIIMSVIQSCKLNNIDPMEYIIAVIENQTDANNNPDHWLPWNFKEQLKRKTA